MQRLRAASGRHTPRRNHPDGGGGTSIPHSWNRRASEALEPNGQLNVYRLTRLAPHIRSTSEVAPKSVQSRLSCNVAPPTASAYDGTPSSASSSSHILVGLKHFEAWWSIVAFGWCDPGADAASVSCRIQILSSGLCGILRISPAHMGVSLILASTAMAPEQIRACGWGGGQGGPSAWPGCHVRRADWPCRWGNGRRIQQATCGM